MHNLFLIFLNNFINSYNRNELFKLFISLECWYNILQFSIRINSTEVSKQKLHISISLLVYNKTYNKISILGVTPFSERILSVFL